MTEHTRTHRHARTHNRAPVRTTSARTQVFLIVIKHKERAWGSRREHVNRVQREKGEAHTHESVNSSSPFPNTLERHIDPYAICTVRACKRLASGNECHATTPCTTRFMAPRTRCAFVHTNCITTIASTRTPATNDDDDGCASGPPPPPSVGALASCSRVVWASAHHALGIASALCFLVCLGVRALQRHQHNWMLPLYEAC